MKKTILTAVSGLALITAVGVGSANADGHAVSACLITKTDTNPFFVKMKEGATAKAKELGVSLKSYAGKIDGDHQTQVAAIETCIADGAKGILLTAGDDYIDKDYTGKELSIPIHWVNRSHGWSTTKFKQKIAIPFMDGISESSK